MKYSTIALILLAGCGPVPIAPNTVSGNHLTTVHNPMRVEDALQGASSYCAERGMGVRSLGTDNPPYGNSVSRFECIK